MYRRPRRRRMSALLPICTIALLIGGVWMFWPRGEAGHDSAIPMAVFGDPAVAAVPEAVLISDTAESAGTPSAWDFSAVSPPPPVQESAAKAADSSPTVAEIVRESPPMQGPLAPLSASAPTNGQVAAPADEEPTSGAGSSSNRPNAISELMKRYQAGEKVQVRHALNALLASSPTGPDAATLRAHLATIAEEMIFSRKTVANDPLVESYTVKPREYPTVIAKKFDVPHDVILLVNGISDPGNIRAGEALKIPRGPFHAKVYKSQFRLDLYLQDLYVRSFNVGLGLDEGTPEGEWKVIRRQPNPTYFPPASATDKRVIAADDPANPLGDFWIGLQGTSGEAVGKKSYGIHGTIEPQSIGKNESAGCVRMLNEDVAFVYRVLKEGHSTVTILP